MAGGSQRWLTLGELFLQPSELIKLGVILMLAHYLSTREEQMESFLTPLFGAAAPRAGGGADLLAAQPGHGPGAASSSAAMMFFVGGLRWRHLLVLVGARHRCGRRRLAVSCSRTTCAIG